MAWRDGCILVLGAERLAVALDWPSVVSLSLTTIPMAGFEVVPFVTLKFSDLDHCHWEWYSAPAQTTKSKGLKIFPFLSGTASLLQGQNQCVWFLHEPSQHWAKEIE